MFLRVLLVILLSIASWHQPVLAEWPDTGNKHLDSLLSKAKNAPHNEAMKMYDEALKIDPKCADIYAERATHFEEGGQYARALQDCSKALELKPDHAIAYLTKARVYLQSGNYREALASAQKCSTFDDRTYELDSDDLRVWGAALYHLGRYKEALVPLTSGMNYVPSSRKSADALYYRGRCYEKLGELKKALADYDEAIKLAPKRAQYYVARAGALRKSDKGYLAAADEKHAHALPKESHTLFY